MTQTLKPAEWVRLCPDCRRRLILPMERHVECTEARFWARQNWTACNGCGGLRGAHTTTCTTTQGANR